MDLDILSRALEVRQRELADSFASREEALAWIKEVGTDGEIEELAYIGFNLVKRWYPFDHMDQALARMMLDISTGERPQSYGSYFDQCAEVVLHDGEPVIRLTLA